MISLILAVFNFLVVVKDTNLMYCDIKGNVKNPGVYLVNDGDVVNDIIEKAGGLKKNSYVKNINLSKKVTDEMVINILSIDQYEELTYECPKCICEEKNYETNTKKIEETTNKIITTNEVSTTNVITKEPTTTTYSLKEPITITTTEKIMVTTKQDEQTLININEASIDELMTLSGVGEIIAQRIIEYRNIQLFTNIVELKEVKGIGDSLFEKIKEYITL